MAGNITIGTLRAQLTADTSDYKKGLGEATGQTSEFANTISNVGKGIAAAFSFRDIAGGVAEVVENASAIADAAGRMGVSAEAVQRLSFAAQQAGASMGDVGTAIKTMSTKVTDGSKATAEALTGIGLSVDQLRGMAPDQAFAAIADAIAKVPDPMQQSALAVDLFGKAGVNLLPMIKAGITDVGNSAPIMSQKVIESADAAGDQWDKMQGQINALKANAVGPLLDAFVSMPPAIQGVAAGVVGLAPSFDTITMAIIGAGGPVAAFKSLIAMGGSVVSFFGPGGALLGALGSVVTFLTTTLPAAFGTILAFLGPQGIIAVAVLALAGVWYFFGDEITAVVTRVYTAIKTWLVDNVAKLWDQIKGSITSLVQSYRDLWLGPNGIVNVAQRVYEGIRTWLVDKFEQIVAAIKGKIDAVTGFFRGMYQTVVGGSIVPDMITEIGQWFERLNDVMVAPTTEATNAVTGSFLTMAQTTLGNVESFMGSLSSSMGGKTKEVMNHFVQSFGHARDAVGGFIRGMSGDLTGFVDAAIAGFQSIKSWVSGIRDLFRSEESKYVNKPRDDFFGSYGGYEGLAEQLSFAADGNVADQLISALYASRTREDYDRAVDAIVDLIGHGTGYRYGTPGLGFENFGAGRMVALHGQEAVVPKDSAERFASNWTDTSKLESLTATMVTELRATRDAVHFDRMRLPGELVSRQLVAVGLTP
jgi:hypothetical protein